MIPPPVISIVMPTFDRLEFLPATVQSVFMQSLSQWELIIADDGSSPNTLSYLETLSADKRVRLLRLDHSGNPGAARNVAIAAARAPWLAFLDSDDLWLPNKLDRQVAQLRANPRCAWSYTAFLTVDAEGTPLASERDRAWTPFDDEIFTQTVRATASIRPSSVVVRTALVRAIGGFDEAINCSEDYDLWMRLALRSPVCVVDEPLVRVRRHAGSDSRAAGSAHRARDYSLRKLAQNASAEQRKLLAEERSRNALAMAAAVAARGGRWRSIAVLGRSLPLGWKYPRWWYGAARAIARALVGGRRRLPQPQGNAAQRQRVSVSRRPR